MVPTDLVNEGVVTGGGAADSELAGGGGGAQVTLVATGGGESVVAGGGGVSVSTSVTGQTVVLTGTVTVVTTMWSDGQSVTTGGQLVMVRMLVAQTVLVVHLGG